MSTDALTAGDGRTFRLTKCRNSSRQVFTLTGRCRICTGAVLGEAPVSFVPYAFFSRRIVRVVFLCESIKLDACLCCSSYFQLRFIVFQAATLNTCCRARICHVPKRTLSSRYANMTYLPRNTVNKIQGHRWNGSSWGALEPMFLVKMKVKIIFDRHTHDLFFGENGKKHIRSYPKFVITIPYAQCH